MACGIPVITTAGGATDDFCSPEYTYLIPSKRVSFEPEDMRLASGAGWVLEPDIETLKSLLRQVYENRKPARERALVASDYVRSRYGWENIAEKVKSQIEILIRRPILRRISK
jgi:glycosyltransferase involved in cell wall biosynthesis